jgi:uncharacterized protein
MSATRPTAALGTDGDYPLAGWDEARMREALTGSPAQVANLLCDAAYAGIVQAQALFGQILLDGNGVQQDRHAAFGWFNRAAAKGHWMALNMVGRCYDLGWGTAIDKARAAECYRIAADQGLPHAMYNYATLLTLGEGVTQDRGAALEWFRRAAAGDDALISAKSANYIGSFYEDGWVVARDIDAARAQYRIAAEGGDFRGQFNYARLLAYDKENAQALQWLARVRETATPAFLAKAIEWLASCDNDMLRTSGSAVLQSQSRETENAA